MSDQTGRIAIITDSTCDILPELVRKHEVIVIPQYIVWGEDELRDGLDINATAFYTRLQEDPVHPKTSQPTPLEFARAIEESGAEEAIIITLSKELSGTFSSASAARGMVNVPVHVVDSRAISMGLGWQVLAAARARDRGGIVEEVIAEAERVRDRLSVFVFVDTLDYMHRGGRVGGVARLVSAAFQLKLLLNMDTSTGLLKPVEHVRTRKRVLRRIVETAFERVDTGRPLHVAVLHGAAPDDAQTLLEEIKARYEPVELLLGETTPIIGVHTGPGGIGLCVYDD